MITVNPDVPTLADCLDLIIRLLAVDDHDITGEEASSSVYQTFLAGNYSGCASCQAAMVAQALKQGDIIPFKRIASFIALDE